MVVVVVITRALFIGCWSGIEHGSRVLCLGAGRVVALTGQQGSCQLVYGRWRGDDCFVLLGWMVCYLSGVWHG